MPDVDKLSPKDRAALLGCIREKNNKWKEAHHVEKVPEEVNKKHFSQCAKSLGLE